MRYGKRRYYATYKLITGLSGEPVDIPDDVFISVRVEMPADSVYSRSLHERGNES
ncbi:hypothetical protein U0026_09995 [Kluyvera intermedia]|uniref:hypothetical protein n=1 Tax=Kluyvera intermedia TaxID=61648 RepID=UPI000A4CD43C|nr:hypothetical protein [Kluyvera intermedia]WQD31420.1 hypothetical protein U0026_09375 [Kluyvera intermedia]WQD31526.1 hypothetical protein U0026_09995 [Kluyvera intermedia]VDZ82737.1 Uncharacterised protein [Kluyvera intermedia]VDZ82859.1 Uncharacterised protein [Kluyvera intermedia]